MERLIIGCGYLGRRVADRWLAAGDAVHVLTRSTAHARQWEAAGLRPLIGDVTDPATLPALPAADTLLWAVGYDRHSGRTQREVYVDGWRHALQSLAPRTGRVIYISSTGVYGQQDGSLVDEQSVCRPSRPGGRLCLEAEQLLLASDWSSRAVILRLAGIYGPQRVPRLRQLQAGEPLRCQPAAMLNLIHVDDAARAVIAASRLSLTLPAVYVIADGHPVRRGEFYQELARLYQTPPPVFADTSQLQSASERNGGDKRMVNDRMRRELGVDPRFATYRDGLAALHRHHDQG